MRPLVSALPLALSLGACAPAPSPATREDPRARPGKLELFGDATRLPTRAGERARLELALAGELAATLDELGLGQTHVEVRLAAADEPGAVVVLATEPSPTTRAALERDASLDQTIRALATAVVPELAPADVRVVLRPRPAELDASAPAPEPRAPIWALVLAALGLGVSVGVSVERGRHLLDQRRHSEAEPRRRAC